MSAVVVFIIAAAALSIGLGVGLQEDDNWHNQPLVARQQRASEILALYPLVDGHNDLPWQYYTRTNNSVWSVDLDIGWPEVHTDIPRLRQGQVGAQFWACFVLCDTQYTDAVRMSLNQMDTIRKIVHRYPEDFAWVTTAQGIEDAFAAGKIGSLVGLEGGHSIASSLGNLRMFYNLGVRYMTVTHSCNTPWADNWKVDNDNSYEFNGLSPFGELVVKEMNRLGMMVDLSHTAKETMMDAIRVSRAPVIFSHSSAYTECNHNRNVRDDVMPLVAANGGVIMVTFVNAYINCSETASIENVADHIDHIKNQIGADYVGIGGDYDGVTKLPVGLENVSFYPDLFAELIRRGWSSDDLQKLAGRNLVRVFRKVEEVRDSLVNEPPFEQILPEAQLHDKNMTCRTSDFYIRS